MTPVNADNGAKNGVGNHLKLIVKDCMLTVQSPETPSESVMEAISQTPQIGAKGVCNYF
jgi:hypothetical protein